MPTKFDKITFALSLFIVLPVAGWVLWLDAMSGMWKSDLIFLSSVVLFIALGATAVWVGHSLRGKIHPTRKMIDRFMLGSMVAIVSDCALVVIVAATVGYQPWLLSVVGSILGVGVSFLLSAALLRGSMQEMR